VDAAVAECWLWDRKKWVFGLAVMVRSRSRFWCGFGRYQNMPILVSLAQSLAVRLLANGSPRVLIRSPMVRQVLPARAV